MARLHIRFRKNFKRARAAKGLSLERVATKARLSVGYVSLLERGLKQAPALDVIERLTHAVGEKDPAALLRP